MDELAEQSAPEYVLTLANLLWWHRHRNEEFAITTIEGFRGLCKYRSTWVKNIELNRIVAENLSMLCPTYEERQIAIAAFERWPEADANTYAIFDPKDLPHVPSIATTEASRAATLPGSGRSPTSGPPAASS